ncbi:hypothetical protein PHYBLDRAFT_169923 [Phycomyces blakesleeanus NRRL 1555(-)]|uniref:Uncharacterized protein n=1 Tax=Phycomyces blakesleeanus (strain ATCC 8743b / DSM 1359 / FGSC 10004 / NBRC 33097 / NRRL 1555) TaxID=763407 RepID=A0A162PQM4_PHYB8|nr:hypothetical protein PHYBLDRAFT_169923 [Phycomyces blakesleeanus NRRL 1555(-)]OAD72016.1 hypothetical protein PHYBLDRAFT_169923 [Phycomyces blakesleeanus NRRL 1555(-)]|eukprot:XP_018290056.1 hypothetical protein PHYBLDRAFT_169923 [Phycomyces blakesleeanus NRRL 1555(-)]
MGGLGFLNPKLQQGVLQLHWLRPLFQSTSSPSGLIMPWLLYLFWHCLPDVYPHLPFIFPDLRHPRFRTYTNPFFNPFPFLILHTSSAKSFSRWLIIIFSFAHLSFALACLKPSNGINSGLLSFHMPLSTLGSGCFTTRSHIDQCCITVFPPYFPPLIVHFVEQKLTLKIIFFTHVHSSFLSGTHSGSHILAFPLLFKLKVQTLNKYVKANLKNDC